MNDYDDDFTTNNDPMIRLAAAMYDDRDQDNPCEFSEDFDWSKWDFDSDRDWR